MTARVGVLSDVAIKHHCPEFFPPDLMTHKAMHPTHLQTNIFRGIKVPKETKTQTDFARFPINDLQNFAMVAAPARTQEASMEAVYNYRKQLGSTNTPSDIQQGYAEQMKSVHVPRVMKRPESLAPTVIGSSTMSDASTDLADLSSLTHVPASLTLGKNTKRQGMEQFDAEFRIAKSFMEPQTRAMVANIANTQDIEGVLNIMFPDGFHPRGGRISHGEALSKLNHEYRGDRASLAIIARADAAAKSQGVIPEQGTGLMSYVLGAREHMFHVDEELSVKTEMYRKED
jgi:hypothetical protein